MTTDPIERGPLPAVVDWLTARHPQDVDQTLASQASSRSVSLKAIYESRYPTGPHGERLPSVSMIVGYEVGGSPEMLADVAARVERAMTAAPASIIAKWLAILSVRVNRRTEDLLTERLRLEDTIRNLSAYPADVVHEALLGQVWKFWPTWYELHKICEHLTLPRRRMLAALCAKHTSELAEEARTPASREETKSILEEFGFTSERSQAVKARPMARSEAELMEHQSSERVPHWSEGADPEGPEMQALRRARGTSIILSDGEKGEERMSVATSSDDSQEVGAQRTKVRRSRAS